MWESGCAAGGVRCEAAGTRASGFRERRRARGGGRLASSQVARSSSGRSGEGRRISDDGWQDAETGTGPALSPQVGSGSGWRDREHARCCSPAGRTQGTGRAADASRERPLSSCWKRGRAAAGGLAGWLACLAAHRAAPGTGAPASAVLVLAVAWACAFRSPGSPGLQLTRYNLVGSGSTPSAFGRGETWRWSRCVAAARAYLKETDRPLRLREPLLHVLRRPGRARARPPTRTRPSTVSISLRYHIRAAFHHSAFLGAQASPAQQQAARSVLLAAASRTHATPHLSPAVVLLAADRNRQLSGGNHVARPALGARCVPLLPNHPHIHTYAAVVVSCVSLRNILAPYRR